MNKCTERVKPEGFAASMLLRLTCFMNNMQPCEVDLFVRDSTIEATMSRQRADGEVHVTELTTAGPLFLFYHLHMWSPPRVLSVGLTLPLSFISSAFSL